MLSNYLFVLQVCFLHNFCLWFLNEHEDYNLKTNFIFFVSVHIHILNERFCSFPLRIFVTIFRFCSFLCSTYLLPFFRFCSYSHFERKLLFVSVTNIYYNFFFVYIRLCITSIYFTDPILQVCCSFLSEAIYLLYQCLNSNYFCIWMRSGDECALSLFNFRLVLEEMEVGQKKGGRKEGR